MNKNFSTENGKNSGIYSITHRPSGKIYIGSALSLNRRYSTHLNQFKHKTNSPYLQRFYNKNIPDDFHMEILELTEKNELILCEQKWINKYFDNQNMCFNISPTAGNCLGVKASEKKKQILSKIHAELWKTEEYRNKMLNIASVKRKQYSLLSPDHILYEGFGIEGFCNDNNLSVSHICEILTGQILSYKGWRLPANKDYEFDRTKLCRKIGLKKAVMFNIKLISPDGEIFGPIVNLNAFCQIHSLHRVSIRKLMKKEIKQTKGWILYNE